MTIFVITVLSLLVVLLGGGCFILYKIARAQLTKVTTYEEWIASIRDDIHGVHKRMIELDDKEWFRKDEDVGVVFDDLVKTIEWLDERVIDVE